MDHIVRILAEFDKGTVQSHYSVTNAFQLFLGKVYRETCCREVCKKWDAMFLLSTNVINDS